MRGLAEVNGARLSYEVAGDGHPLVLVHAGIADSRMWDGQFDVFAERFRTVRWDMRGFGESPMAEGPFSNRDDLHGLMGVLGIDRAALIGVSQGGGVVIDMALEHPEMVRGLVLSGSAVGGFEFEAPEPPQWPELVAAYRAGDMARAAELEAEMWVVGRGRTPADVDPSVLTLVREMDEIALGTEVARGELERSLDPPAVGRLAEIAAPTLIVVGDHDQPDVVAASELLGERIAGSRRVVIPDTAHFPNLDHPSVFNDLVLEFLASR